MFILISFQHFKEDHYFYAHDPNNECKTGDHVVIRQLEQKKSPIIQHEVVQLVYKCGNTVDPLTGKPCVASQYREDIDAIIDQFGRLSSTFEYKDAPPRGRFEQDRDITALPVYRKWHEDGIDDPYGVQVDPNPKLPKKEKLLYKNKIIK